MSCLNDRVKRAEFKLEPLPAEQPDADLEGGDAAGRGKEGGDDGILPEGNESPSL